MNRRFQSAAVAAVTFVIVTALGIAIGPAKFAGDDLEYLAMTYAWAANGNATLTPAVVEAVRAANPDLPGPPLVNAVDGSNDTLHFWFLSALAAPFLLLCNAFGVDWNHCFVFVNGLALAAAIGVTHYYFQWRGAALLAIGFLASPFLPYLNKAHGEAYSVSLFTVAVAFLARDQLLAAALAAALIAAQVSAFSPLAAILLLYWAIREWRARRRPAPAELSAVAACLCLLILQPAWTLWRHGALNVIVKEGFVKPELVSLKRSLGLLIDPDIGLLFNWPVGVALALLTAIGLWRNPKLIRDKWAFWMFAAWFSAYLAFVSATQVNYTSSVPRYGLWLLPLFLIGLLLVDERESARGARKFAAAIALVWIGCSTANFCYYAAVTGFPPVHKRRPQAELWYRIFPAAFDPEEQVFVDYTLNQQHTDSYALFLRGRYPINLLRDPDIWALSNKACTKLLVFAYAFTSSYVQSRLPFGCEEPLDPARLLAYVQRDGGSGMRDRYVNISQSQLAPMRLSTALPVPAPPPNHGPRVDSITTTSRNGSEVTYVVRVSDVNGWQDIDSIFLMVTQLDNASQPGSICYVVYNQQRNLVATKTGTEELIHWYPGRPKVLRGANCTVNTGNVTLAAGESLTLTLPVTLDPVLAKPALVQAGVTDLAQVTSGWQRAR